MPTSIDDLIERQLRLWEHERRRHPESVAGPRPEAQHVITVSRQHGSGGVQIASELAERFGYTLLHRNVIDRMCESSGHSRRLLEVLDERARSELTSWFESVFGGKYVDTTDYVSALLKTLYSIARLGGVVVVGRGANFIVGPDRGVHFRVVAPFETRVRSIMERHGLDERRARHRVETCDRERAEFMRKVYGRSVDDPLGYDLIVNEAGLTRDQVVALLAGVAQEKFKRLRASASPAAA